ncbi:hypothetical protein WME89_39025 [Sorangium sp. So ce321]|uniref:hypothetical protein n=1 Tax=Sorangium sp. So ce321 TaxID=3133300 RepID=UPI003F631100
MRTASRARCPSARRAPAHRCVSAEGVNPGGWIAKLSPVGDVLWTSGPLGGTSPRGIVDVAVDSEGNAIGVGYYSGGDTFVVKLAP